MLFSGLLLAACGAGSTTGSAFNGWTTPVGYASATHPARLDPSTGVVTNAEARNGTYDSKHAGPCNTPSSFGMVPPPATASGSDQITPQQVVACSDVQPAFEIYTY